MADDDSDVVVRVPPRAMTRYWTAALPTPLVAVMLSSNVPLALDGGVPEMVAVPLRLSRKTKPGGKVPPDTLRTGTGEPVVVTVKALYCPGRARQPETLVMTGAPPRLSARYCTAGLPTPLVAVTVTS